MQRGEEAKGWDSSRDSGCRDSAKPSAVMGETQGDKSGARQTRVQFLIRSLLAM